MFNTYIRNHHVSRQPRTTISFHHPSTGVWIYSSLNPYVGWYGIMHTVLHIQQKMDVPSGKRLQETMVKIIVFSSEYSLFLIMSHSRGKSPVLMVKSTINGHVQ